MENWKKKAACRFTDVEMFFPDFGRGMGITKKRWNYHKKKLPCNNCPVTEQCQQLGERFGSDGIWGGRYYTSKGKYHE